MRKAPTECGTTEPRLKCGNCGECHRGEDLCEISCGAVSRGGTKRNGNAVRGPRANIAGVNSAGSRGGSGRRNLKFKAKIEGAAWLQGAESFGVCGVTDLQLPPRA